MNTVHRQLRNMLANSLAVIGLFLGSGSEENCAEPDPVTQYFVPLREENYEATEGKRSQYTSMVAMRPSSCFFSAQ